MNHLVTAHLGIARAVARRCLMLFGTVVELEDLTQEASVALVRAARFYKAGMRAAFSTYAHRACWRGCTALVRSTLRRREVSNLNVERVGVPSELSGRADGVTGMELWALGGRVLSEVEQQVLLDRFTRGLTLKEAGKRRGVTPGRVWQIELKALGKLSRAMGWEREKSPKARQGSP